MGWDPTEHQTLKLDRQAKVWGVRTTLLSREEGTVPWGRLPEGRTPDHSLSQTSCSLCALQREYGGHSPVQDTSCELLSYDAHKLLFLCSRQLLLSELSSL